jgi:hypothetical protein
MHPTIDYVPDIACHIKTLSHAHRLVTKTYTLHMAFEPAVHLKNTIVHKNKNL